MENEHEVYEKEGVTGNVNGMITLFVGLGVIGIVIVFLGALGGQTYNQVAPTIDSIPDGNSAVDPTGNLIQGYVKSSINSGFQAQSTGAGYLPLLVGAIILIVVIGLLVSVSSNTSGGGGSGGAL
jgi:hypothetical protein